MAKKHPQASQPEDPISELTSPAMALVTLCDKLYSSQYDQENLLGDLIALNEASLLLQQTLKKASQDNISTINARLRHDLRNQLGLIKGYAELLMEESDASEIRKSLASILAAAQDILHNPHLVSPSESEALEHSSLKNPEPKALTRLQGERRGAIIIIDDDFRNCELLERHLQNTDHLVISFQSGEDALDYLENNDADVIFLDLIMPEPDGFEVLQRLKQNEQTRAIPVIMVSGIQDAKGVARCIEAGADDYLFKPVDATLLRARLSAGLERKRWLDKENQYRMELERSHSFIRQIFGRYLSDDIVANLLEQPEGLDLGGVKRKVSILMADIRGFTPLCESLPPERVVALINNYVGQMSEIIIRNYGTIDEILGDAILAIFGAPVSREDDTERAIACAIEMQNAMSRINQQNLDMQLPVIEVGIGLNTGEVIAGNIGSERRAKYGVVGHHVNLTARIEDYTQGNEILASQYTVSDCAVPLRIAREFSATPKGVAEPVNIYQITGIEGHYQKYIDSEPAEVAKEHS